MSTEDAFLKYAKSLEEAEKKRNEKPSFTPVQREYEEVLWTGLEPGKDKVVRILGNPPGFGEASPTDARVVVISRIVADDGKMIRVCRPSYEYFVNNGDTPEYFLDKVIRTAKSNRWINGKKVCLLQERNPELYNKIDKNGFDPSDFRYKVDKGWAGRSVFLANVIDRSQMETHRDKKHTMLLSKKISYKGDREYAEDGVPAYGFVDKLIPKVVAYGVWENYDIAIRKTGQMSNPYQVCVASRVPEEVQSDVRPFIVNNTGLTEEEASWERYDLNKLYMTTSYTKLWNRLRDTIKAIDVELDTHFYEELKELADKERAEMQAKEEASKEGTPEPQKSPEMPAMNEAEAALFDDIPALDVTPPRGKRVPASTINWDLLPHADLLTDAQRSMIKSVSKGEDGLIHVEYDTKETLYRCVEGCEISELPESFTICPVCGSSQI